MFIGLLRNAVCLIRLTGDTPQFDYGIHGTGSSSNKETLDPDLW